MITITFIGSDKNAGKTTVFNHIYNQYQDMAPKHPICVTSTGISGEAVDAFYGHSKPSVFLLKNSYFINAKEHLSQKKEVFETLCRFTNPPFMKEYVLAKCLSDFQVILEGPNSKKESLLMKKEVYKRLKNPVFLIDGSVDRQFVAHPEISDSLFYCVLISQNEKKIQKTKDLLFPLSIPVCSDQLKTVINKNKTSPTKSILLDSSQKIIYKGEKIPFLDSQLKGHFQENKNKKCFFYLNGALSKSLFSFLSSYKNFSIILDNFTQYLNVSTDLPAATFQPTLYLLHQVNINGIFTIEEPETNAKKSGLIFPKNIRIHNLFKAKETATDFLSGFIKEHLSELKGQ